MEVLNNKLIAQDIAKIIRGKTYQLTDIFSSDELKVGLQTSLIEKYFSKFNNKEILIDEGQNYTCEKD
jgi:hypothetical protein